VLRHAGNLPIGSGVYAPLAPPLPPTGAPAPPAPPVGGTTGPGVTVTSPATIVASSVNALAAAAFSVTLIGPAGFAAAWTISDGVRTISGTTTIGAAGTTVIVVDVSLLADGSVTISLLETDPFGNHESATATVVKDVVGPSLTASVSATTSDVGGTLTATWSASDTMSAVTISATLDGAAVTSGALDTFTLTSGAHTLTISATDAVGNVTTRTISFTIRPTAAGILAAINQGAVRGYMTAAEKTTLVNSINNVVGASGGSGAAKLRSFISTVQSATATQLLPAYRALLLDWANDLLTRV
jgi:hypothetical protein